MKHAFFSILVIFALLSFAIWLEPTEAKQPPKRSNTLDGLYLNKKLIETFNPQKQQWEKGHVSDCLKIEALPKPKKNQNELVPSEFLVDVLLVQNSANLCAITTHALLKENRLLIQEKEEKRIHSEPLCEMQIEILPDRFVFQDPNHSCQDNCGVRAGFHGVSISRKGTKQKPSSQQRCNETDP